MELPNPKRAPARMNKTYANVGRGNPDAPGFTPFYGVPRASRPTHIS